MELKETFQRVKAASKELALISDERKNAILLQVADAIIAQKDMLLRENAKDLARMEQSNPLYDRLQLTDARLEGIASDMRHVATLENPLGKVLKHRTLENGLVLTRISVPFGVIGVIYEARPNVSFDVFSLCFKSGNACVLKGGRDADDSNRAIISLIHEVLEREGVNPAVVELLPATHEATGEMLNAVGYIDVCIPRGGKKLIQFVRDTAKVPVIETGAEKRLQDLSKLIESLLEHNPAVTLYCDEASFEALKNDSSLFALHSSLIQHATEESFGTEFMDYKMAIKTVASLDEALQHIDRYGSGHSESIITDNAENARRFQQEVDAACVYVNAPTSFTDGAQFGLGAEIGISTQKLGPRGPMALEEMCTYKWLIEGNGQIRP